MSQDMSLHCHLHAALHEMIYTAVYNIAQLKDKQKKGAGNASMPCSQVIV